MIRNTMLGVAGLLVATGLAACAPDTLPPPQNTGAPASPTAGGPLDGTPEPDSELSGRQGPNHPARHYDCDNGTTVQARYPESYTALVTYKSKTMQMHLAKSADGARYVGDDREWWTRGTGDGAKATLFTHKADGSTGNVIASCHEK